VLGGGEQILVVGYREETQRADVLQVGKAEVDLAAFELTDDVAGRAALDLQLDVGTLAGDPRQERRQHADGGWIIVPILLP
jgi:hypothetical protein